MTGTVDAVMKELLAFLSENVPTYELASKLALKLDFAEFLSACEDVFAVTPEGVVVVAATNGLTDRELVLLHLVRAKIAYVAGKVDKDLVLSTDLVSSTKRTSGTVAGRLSELCGEGLAERLGKGEYRVTTFGLHRFREDVIPKLKPAK